MSELCSAYGESFLCTGESMFYNAAASCAFQNTIYSCNCVSSSNPDIAKCYGFEQINSCATIIGPFESQVYASYVLCMICLFLSIVVALVSSRYCCCPLDGSSTNSLQEPIYDHMDDESEYNYGYGYGSSYEGGEVPCVVAMPSSCIPTDAVIVTIAPATAAVSANHPIDNDASFFSIAEPVLNDTNDGISGQQNRTVVSAVPM